MTLDQLNKNYIYTSDTIKFKRVEHWEIMTPDADGKYRGDCEDYVLTLKAKIDGFSNIDLYYCKIFGNGHCIGIRNGMIIDCNAKRWLDIHEYTAQYQMTDLKKYTWFILLFKKLQAKVQRGLNELQLWREKFREL